MRTSGMPLLGALVPGTWCASHAVTALVVGASVGRQSSTAGIGPFLLLLSAVPLAVFGCALGRLAERMLGTRAQRVSRSIKFWAPPLLISIAALAALRAGLPILAAEREATPRVIVASGIFGRRQIDLPIANVTRATRVYDYSAGVNTAIQWAGGSAELHRVPDGLAVSFLPTGGQVTIPLPAIDYILCVDAVHVRITPGADPALALLITGRATGQRDLLAVVSGAGELVYLELLERRWDFRTVQLLAIEAPGGDRIVVGLQQYGSAE